jgi:hypothetical protein
MSYDLAVWFHDRILSDEQALEQYRELREGNVNGLISHPAIGKFYLELYKIHPEVDDVPEDNVDNFDFSPWSIAHNFSDHHMIISCVWSHADYVHDLVLKLAQKHGFAVFDPQLTKIHYPTDQNK